MGTGGVSSPSIHCPQQAVPCDPEKAENLMTGRARRNDGERSYGALLLVCCLVSFTCFFGSYLRIPVLPLYAASLGAGTVQVGLINACFLLMAGLLSIPFGILSDRMGRRSFIVAGLAILSGSSFLLWLSTTPLQMMGIYLLFGAGLLPLPRP